MRLYLDDDSVNRLLVRMLRQAGHDVCLPSDVGLTSAHDAEHLAKAVVENRGILTVRKDNNPKRDLTVPGIVRAITKLLAAGVPIPDHLHVLNHWR